MKDSYNSDIKVSCQPTTTILNNPKSNNNIINNNSNSFEYYNSNNNDHQIIIDSETLLNKINNINNSSNNSINNNNNDDENYIMDGASIIKCNINQEDTINWENEVKLEIKKSNFIDSITPAIDSIRIKSLRVLVTGCTGYLGSHVLVHLLRIINCETVYCMIRGVKSTFKANERINNSLKKYELYNQISEREFQKVIPVIGDLEKDRFGLSENEYQHLAKSTHLIINLASNNNFNSSYNECKSTNINGIKELIKLSTLVSLKRIVHISPSFLSFNDNQQQLPMFCNNNYNNINGFLNSKSVQEHLINQFTKEFNIPTMIIRSPFIISYPNSLVSSIIQGCLSSGTYPIDIEFKTNTVPIEWLSETIINTIFNDNSWTHQTNSDGCGALKIFNIVGEPITLKEIFSIISKEYQLSPSEFNEWVSILKSTNQNETTTTRTTLLNNIQFIKTYPNNYKQSNHTNISTTSTTNIIYNNKNNSNNNSPKITKDIIKKINFKLTNK